jgi:hypothetical protein
MALFRSKRVRNRVILIQAIFVAGLIALYKFGMPGIEKAGARAAAEQREQAITEFFQSVTVEVGGSANPAVNGPASAESGGGPNQEAGTGQKAIPKRLRDQPEVQEVERELGAPDQTMSGYRGAQHLTWIGTRHKLRASFNKGQLYALTITNLETGHGETVYETSAYWRAF